MADQTTPAATCPTVTITLDSTQLAKITTAFGSAISDRMKTIEFGQITFGSSFVITGVLN